MKGKKTGGRKKGTPNKATQTIKQKLSELGCEPVEGMAKIAMDADAAGDTETALKAYKAVAEYVVPKLRSIEVIKNEAEPEPMQFSFNVLPPKGEVTITQNGKVTEISGRNG